MKAFFLDHDHETNRTHLVMSISDICYKYDTDSNELYAVIDLTDYPHLLKTFANCSDLDTECRKLQDEKKELVDYYEKELREMRCNLRKLRENLNNIRMKCIAIQQICAEV